MARLEKENEILRKRLAETERAQEEGRGREGGRGEGGREGGKNCERERERIRKGVQYSNTEGGGKERRMFCHIFRTSSQVLSV